MEDHCAETKATSERAERLADLLMLSYEPMLAWNLDGSIEFWNAGAERLYGFAPDEAVGRGFDLSVHLLERLLNVGFCCEAYSNRHVHRAWKNLSEVRENPSRW